MAATEATVISPIEDWKDVPWRTLERRVFRLQKRIYRAQSRGNDKAVRSLQRLLLKSWSARMLAVRRVTQENQGKRTAGIDGIKHVSPTKRFALVATLGQPDTIRAQPVRRALIPKPGKEDQVRPLGIPVMLDRAHQALVKLALEPQWEARFEPNSYGFRPGRSCHDAIAAVFNELRFRDKYILDADIADCFEGIRQKVLLAKLAAPRVIRHAVRAWLKAGVLDGVVFTPTTSGTPQGGVASPLLANIALDGMEAVVRASYRRTLPHSHTITPSLIRYADDVVVLCADHDGIVAAQGALEGFLAELGLTLHPTKTRIIHSLHPLDEATPGFDFLGFTVRQHPVGKCHAGKRAGGRGRLLFKTLIRPSKASIRGHVQQTGQIIRTHRGLSQDSLIYQLSPVITGWAGYPLGDFRTSVASQVYRTCDLHLYNQLRSWAYWRHPRKSRGWIVRKYWSWQPGRRWTFRTPGGKDLPRHSDVSSFRHVKVRGSASPYDGNLAYWTRRLSRHPLVRSMESRLLRGQGGRCPWCGLTFRDDDQWEIDHIHPTGGEQITNKQLLHRHCHDQKTAQMGDYRRRGYP